MSMSSSGRSVKNKCTEIIFNVVLFIICANLQYPKSFPLELCFYQFCNKPQCNSFNFLKIKWRIYVFVNNVNIDSDIGMSIIQHQAII